MPILIEHLTEVVIITLLVVILANAVIIALAIGRRQRRERYFRRIDDLRERYGPVIEAVLAQKIEYGKGLKLLQEITGADRLVFLERLCLETKPAPHQVPLLRQLAEGLGLVKLWQEQLTGVPEKGTRIAENPNLEVFPRRTGRLGFLVRARAADKLGTIQHQPSWPLLTKALRDPHRDVRMASLRALAEIREPNSFPTLVEQLHATVLKPSENLSIRMVKSALISFPLSQASFLADSLRHSHRRIRFLATDIVREMVEREAALEEDFVLELRIFPDELVELFLTQLCFDENPDVRARTATVISYLPDSRSTSVLLTLLDDAEWFVRLHATRALGKRKFLPQAAQIKSRLTDANWMVREAAVRTLLVFGQAGTEQLSEHFLTTQDRYSQEQIADEMQRSGLIPALLRQFGSNTDVLSRRVLGRLIEMGKTSYLIAVLQNSPDRDLRRKFLVNYSQHPDVQIQAWLMDMATRESDTELRTLAQASVGTLKA